MGPSGVPVVNDGHILPDDVLRFYTLCGGVSLYLNNDYSVRIVSPQDFVLANPVIVGEVCEDDISSTWYIVADDFNGDYLTIDLDASRLGRCYDSYFDVHGMVGGCPIIATSFTDLLRRLITNKGEYWYWLSDDFKPIGDAYDA